MFNAIQISMKFFVIMLKTMDIGFITKVGAHGLRGTMAEFLEVRLST